MCIRDRSIEATVQFEGEAVQQLGTLGGFADSQQVVTVTPADISPPESQYIGLDGAEIEFNTPDLTTPLAVRFHPFSHSLKRLYDVAARIREERLTATWSLTITDTVTINGDIYRRIRTFSEATLVNAGDSDIGRNFAGDVVFTWRAKEVRRTVPDYPDVTSQPVVQLANPDDAPDVFDANL